MDQKKTHRANLENKKLFFFQIGLISVLLLLYIAFEWTAPGGEDDFTVSYSEFPVITEEIIMPVTRRDRTPNAPPPPPPLNLSEIFDIIGDEEAVEEALFVEDVELPKETYFGYSQKIELEEEKFEESEGKVHFIVDQMPDFQGMGLDGFRRYISKNTSYPPSRRRRNVEGSVYVRFIVNTNGSVSDVTVMRSLDSILDQEAIRIVESSPRWIPGIHEGSPVRVVLTFPVNFSRR